MREVFQNYQSSRRATESLGGVALLGVQDVEHREQEGGLP